jgi:hypothetical protein
MLKSFPTHIILHYSFVASLPLISMKQVALRARVNVIFQERSGELARPVYDHPITNMSLNVHF